MVCSNKVLSLTLSASQQPVSSHSPVLPSLQTGLSTEHTASLIIAIVRDIKLCKLRALLLRGTSPTRLVKQGHTQKGLLNSSTVGFVE